MLNDPIADFIIRLKNASAAGKKSVIVPYSRLKYDIALKLQKARFVAEVEKHGKKVKKTLEIELIYRDRNKPRITNVRRLSKPSHRVYKNVAGIRPVRHGSGLLVLSTPRGVLTGEEARKEKVGGEALFTIW